MFAKYAAFFPAGKYSSRIQIKSSEKKEESGKHVLDELLLVDFAHLVPGQFFHDLDLLGYGVTWKLLPCSGLDLERRYI